MRTQIEMATPIPTAATVVNVVIKSEATVPHEMFGMVTSTYVASPAAIAKPDSARTAKAAKTQ
jgi:hypothetical protein